MEESANEDAREAVRANDEENLCDALGRGADPNFRFGDLTGDFNSDLTLLTYACYHAFDACCRLLLARGADPNLPGGFDQRPLHCACIRKDSTRVASQRECVRQLLDAGAEVNLCSGINGPTALHLACGRGHEPIVKFLIRRGASLEVKTFDSFTPLGFAVSCGRRETALTLLRAGAKLKALIHRYVSPGNQDLNDYMIEIVNEGGWAARARKHEDACLRVVSRCVRLPRDVMLSIATYWSLPH